MFGNSGGSGGRVCSLQFAGDKIVSTNKWRTAESQTAREKRFKFIAPTCAICIHSSPLVAPFLRFMGENGWWRQFRPWNLVCHKLLLL